MPKVGKKEFPYTKAGKKAALEEAKKAHKPMVKKHKAKDMPPKKGKDGFTNNPMSAFRGNKTTMKRPSGRKR